MSAIGILYSTTSGIVLRIINPDNVMGDAHLEWLDQNKPEGTTLLTIEKDLVGADENNCPNLDFLIPFVKKNLDLDLKTGVQCSVIDEKNEVIASITACPDLYKKRLLKDEEKLNKDKLPQEVKAVRTLIEKPGSIGQVYDKTDGQIKEKTVIE